MLLLDFNYIGQECPIFLSNRSNKRYLQSTFREGNWIFEAASNMTCDLFIRGTGYRKRV